MRIILLFLCFLFAVNAVAVKSQHRIHKEERLVQNLLKSPVFRSMPESEARRIAERSASSVFGANLTEVMKPLMAQFPCQSTGRSPTRPTNARRLLPGDIDAVAAIGDSIVAAFGALSTSIFTVFTEYRGYSFAVGGEKPFETFVTVPNVLKKYNSNLKGFSIGNGDQNNANAQLNVAVSGARSYDLKKQVEALTIKLSKAPYDLRNDWKLINVFVGGNDLCDYCKDTTKNSPKNYQANIEEALDLIKANIPRAFVSLISPPDVTLLGKVSSGLCGLLHAYECGCATNNASHVAHREYVRVLFETQEKAKYKDQQDFHLVVQPFLAELQLPMKNGAPDTSYFAPDCFHFSGVAHQAASVALWNNMVEPENKKKTWFPGEQIECPKVGQYLS